MTATYDVIFDGGAKGNPGLGYGSYQITRDGAVIAHTQLNFGANVTNNQAEYMTLLNALQWLADGLGNSASSASVTVHGDSQLVIKQLSGEWKIKDARLRRIAMETRAQMDRFHDVSLTWHRRDVSVQRLGH
ncbi:MAG TPA: ribonuclease HI family protein [Thermomicrobiales bacterium]|nr:ribonuclease HI family protein [Thermomicrobiales bacterium]